MSSKHRVSVRTENAPAPSGPFSQAVDDGRTVYVAGQLGIDMTTGKLVEDVREQTDLVLRHIAAILDQVSLDMEHVVRTTIYITDFADYAIVNEVYEQYFEAPFPARATIQAAGLVSGARVEIDAVAVR